MGAGIWGLRSVAAAAAAAAAAASATPSKSAASGEAAFKSMVTELTRAGGDADTNGAVAGALAGCYLGFKSLPQDWIGRMPYSEWLEAWVQKVLFMLGLPPAVVVH